MKNQQKTKQLARAAVLLLVAMLTSIAAWATDVTYTYTVSATTSGLQTKCTITSSSGANTSWSETIAGGIVWQSGEKSFYELISDSYCQIIFDCDKIVYKGNSNSTFLVKDAANFKIKTSGYDKGRIKKVTFKNGPSVVASATVVNEKSINVPLSANTEFSTIIVELTDELYNLVTPGEGLRIDNTNDNGFEHNGGIYFHYGETVVIAPTDANNIISSVTTPIGATIAQDKRSFSFPMPSGNTTPTATLLSGFTITLPNTLTVTSKPNATVDGAGYYLPDATITVQTANQYDIIEEISGIDGATSADDKRSFTFTMPAQNVNISGTTSEVHTVNVPDGLTISDPHATINGTEYYKTGEFYTLTITDNNKIIRNLSGVTDATIAPDRKSATFTMPADDVNISATFLTIGGTCGENATWLMTDTNNDGKYETLNINGSGAINNYADKDGFRPPWWNDFSNTITTVNIADGITTIGKYNFMSCLAIETITLPASVSTINEDGFKSCSTLKRINILKSDGIVSLGNNGINMGIETIVVPTLDLAAEYAKDDNWSAHASNLRIPLGDNIFALSTTDRDGNAATPAYQIATETDLRNLAAAVNEKGQYCQGLTFRQTADITLNGPSEPIGYKTTQSATFKGTYDGGSHTISGLDISTEREYAGLFGYVNGGTVKNVILVSPKVTSSHKTAIVGSVAGYCTGSATVENCHVINPTVSATGSGETSVSAIVGTLWTKKEKMDNCYFYDSNTDHNYDAYGINEPGCTITNVGRARKITIDPAITADASAADPTNGFTYQGENYYREGLTLTLATASGITTAPEGCTISYTANGIALASNTYTVNSTDGDATLSGGILSNGQTYTVKYVDAQGTEHTTEATALNGYEKVTEKYGNQYIDLAAGWYFVGTDIHYTDKTIRPQGEVNIILANGCTMHIGTTDNPTSGRGFETTAQSLSIYGQTLDPATAGTLSYVGTSTGIFVGNYTQHSGNVSIGSTLHTGGIGIDANNVTLNGGRLAITVNYANSYAIKAALNITINGGQLDATATGTGNFYGLRNTNIQDDFITLGYTRATDYIRATNYSVISGKISIADGQTLTDEDGNTYTGTLTDEQIAAIAGKTLRPAITIIDGNTSDPVTFDHQIENATVIYRRDITAGIPTTIMLPFDFDAAAFGDGTFYTFTGVNTKDWTATMTAANAQTTLSANTPYIYMPDKDLTEITFSNVTIQPTANTNTTTSGDWTFRGTYERIVWNTGDDITTTKVYGFAAQTTTNRDGEAITAGEFVRARRNVGINPTRAYLQYTGEDKTLQKSALALPDRISVVFIDHETAAVIDDPSADPTTETPDADPADITTPVSELAPTLDNVKVWSYDHTIYIESRPGTDYRIIDLNGRTLRAAATLTDRDEIRLGTRSGIAIVIINNQTFKIIN